jgi:hypothetical protein
MSPSKCWSAERDSKRGTWSSNTFAASLLYDIKWLMFSLFVHAKQGQHLEAASDQPHSYLRYGRYNRTGGINA